MQIETHGLIACDSEGRQWRDASYNESQGFLQRPEMRKQTGSSFLSKLTVGTCKTLSADWWPVQE